MDDEKEYEMTIQELNAEIAELKLKCIDESKYTEWTPQEIVSWIVSLDSDRFSKYKDVLLQNLTEEGIEGADLCNVNEFDVKGWGIKNFKDKKFIMERITGLVKGNALNHDKDNDNDDNIAIVNDQEGAESGGHHK